MDETFEAIRDSLNQQAINNIARKLAQNLRRAQQGAYPVTESAGRDRVDTTQTPRNPDTGTHSLYLE
ncbi:phage tail fiber assembly protein [Escherichia coli]|nr:phage tail fiber assembly protein [Escherichia coli]